MKLSYFETDELPFTKDSAEKAWLFRIICMALTSVYFGNTF